MSSEASIPFVKCGSCGREWAEWRDFVMDTQIRLLGFQAIAELPDANLLVFEHRCGSSVSVLARRIRHFFPECDSQGEGLGSLFGTDECSQHCRFLHNLEACDRPCANARDRCMIRLVLEMKKSPSVKSV